MKMFSSRRSLAVAVLLLNCAAAIADGAPSLIPSGFEPWDVAAAKQDAALKNAYDQQQERLQTGTRNLQTKANNVKGEEDAAKSRLDQQVGDATMKGLDKGIGQTKTAYDLAKDSLELHKALNAQDERLSPNYTPPGAPTVPSKCMEDKQCRPCFEKAQASINKTRTSLEKVRAHYDYTHRFTKLGQAVLTSAGAAGGGIAAMGASAENIKIDAALADFDKVVKAKNQELLGKLQGNLKDLSLCEAKFYKNEDWYNRYGFIYYQFMQSNYGY